MMQEGYSQTTGLYYRKNSFLPNRPTLLFVHGFSGSSSAWRPYETVLAEQYNIFMYDLRGHGNSPKSRYLSEYTLEHNAQELEQLIKEFQLKQPTAIGHSFGSMILLHFVKARQTLLGKLILLSPGYNPNKRSFGWLAKLSAIVSANVFNYLPFSLKSKGQVNYYPRFVGTGDWYIPRMIQDIGKSTIHVYLYCFYQSLSLNAAPYLKNIALPTYVMHGKRDSLVPYQQSEFIAQQVPGAQLQLIEGACHVLVLNNVAEILQLIALAHSEPLPQ